MANNGQDIILGVKKDKLGHLIMFGWGGIYYNLFIDTAENVVGLHNNHNSLPETYSLNQNYPNPFNPSTVINYQLPKSGNVTLSVYNMLGQEVKVLINEFQQAGTYDVKFDASEFSSGVYFYKIQSGSFTDTKKMTLVK